MISETTIADYILHTFAGLKTTEAMSYTFFFYGDEYVLPMATIATADNPGDNVSNLDRPGVFRLNIGISRESFESLFGAGKVDSGAYDYTALDQIMPHPDYAAQHYICVLNPSEKTWETLRPLLAEAYDLAVRRQSRRQPNQ